MKSTAFILVVVGAPKKILWLMTTDRVIARGFNKYQLHVCTCSRAINVISGRTIRSQSMISLKSTLQLYLRTLILHQPPNDLKWGHLFYSLTADAVCPRKLVDEQGAKQKRASRCLH